MAEDGSSSSPDGLTGRTPVAVDPTMAPPVLVEGVRGGVVESWHRGQVVVADATGRVVAGWGDGGILIYPHAAVQVLQALPLIETGAYHCLHLDTPELALACGSHHGEARHVRLAASWLGRIGCRPIDLECGAQPPLDPATAAELFLAGTAPTVLHNSSSGKHLALLSTARHCRDPLTGYLRPDHPLQRRIVGVLEDMAGVNLARAPLAVDDDGAPTVALPLRGLATALARFADAQTLAPLRAGAVERVRIAWTRHPQLVGGVTSFGSRLMQAAGGPLLVTGGTAGVIGAVLLRRRLAVAVHIDDGSERAANVALMAALHEIGFFDDERWPAVSDLAHPVVTNRVGTVVGGLRPASVWSCQQHQRE